jgi:hypothetical protein
MPSGCAGGNPGLTQNCSYIFIDTGVSSSGVPNLGSIYSPNLNNQGDGINENVAGVVQGGLYPIPDTSGSNINSGSDNTSQINISDSSIILSDKSESKSIIKIFFAKVICKLSHLFNSDKYNQCIDKYL